MTSLFSLAFFKKYLDTFEGIGGDCSTRSSKARPTNPKYSSGFSRSVLTNVSCLRILCSKLANLAENCECFEQSFSKFPNFMAAIKNVVIKLLAIAKAVNTVFCLHSSYVTLMVLQIPLMGPKNKLE